MPKSAQSTAFSEVFAASEEVDCHTLLIRGTSLIFTPKPVISRVGVDVAPVIRAG